MSLSLKDMFRKNNKPSYRMPAGLSPKEQKAVAEIVKKAENREKVPHTAQDSIPFIKMYPDGICRVTENYYTRTIEYQDINYQLALADDQHAIFDEWCSFLNFFDSSIHFELSFMNKTADEEESRKQIDIPHANDGFDSVRDEYSGMLKNQLSRGNNGIVKKKYVTFGMLSTTGMPVIMILPSAAKSKERTTSFI